MRLFVAVRPPAAATASLAEALGRPIDARWHLTLAFLGEQPAPEPFLVPLAEATAAARPCSLSLTGGECFGGRVLSAAVAGDVSDLRHLALDVQHACRRGGAVVEDRPFRPHLTLARGRGLRVPPELASYQGPRWRVDELELVRSRLGRRVEHEVLQRFPLRGA